MINGKPEQYYRDRFDGLRKLHDEHVKDYWSYQGELAQRNKIKTEQLINNYLK